MLFSYLVVVLIIYLMVLLIAGVPVLPQKKKPFYHEFGRDDDPQIDNVKQNYVNGVIDREVFEEALEDVLNGKPNSYGSALYSPGKEEIEKSVDVAEYSPSAELCDRLMSADDIGFYQIDQEYGYFGYPPSTEQ